MITRKLYAVAAVVLSIYILGTVGALELDEIDLGTGIARLSIAAAAFMFCATKAEAFEGGDQCLHVVSDDPRITQAMRDGTPEPRWVDCPGGCGGGMYAGDPTFGIDSNKVCAWCLKDYTSKMDPVELAEAMGIDVEFVTK